MEDNPGVPLASQNSKPKSRLGVRHYDGVGALHALFAWE